MRDIDFAGLMEEPPGGENYGRAASIDPHSTEQHVGLDTVGAQTREFVTDGGWGIVHEKYGAEAGLTAHRGVLRDDEYVDAPALLTSVERELGFTIDDVRSVYRQGRMTETQRELRRLIDGRLLALSRSGANLLELAKLFGWAIEPADDLGGERSKTMERATARARALEAVAA